MKTAIAVAATLLLAACQPGNSVKLVFPDKTQQQAGWTKTELEKTIAIRRLHGDADASAFLVRLNGTEQPHYHDHHDLNVSILSGKGSIHFSDRAVSLTPGDVVFIPKDTYHWAESTSSGATILFAVFSPEFVGKDKRLAK